MWKAKYGGLEVSEARRLKSLEDENRRIKKTARQSRCSTTLRFYSEKTSEACGAQSGGGKGDRASRADSAARL